MIRNECILVTGGAGYVGTHTTLSLIEAGYDVTVVDNLCNSSEEGLKRVVQLTQCEPSRIRFFQCDLRDKTALEEVFKKSQHFKACIHFAGLKAVGESVVKPLLYYETSLLGTLNLLDLMDQYNCHSLIFSSSATVYGNAEVPITENSPCGIGITNPYGRTKYMVEQMLEDFKKSKEGLETKPDNLPWSVVVLRYFNPVGAHPSGRIGEDPNGVPNNLMPFVNQVVVGRRESLTIFGNDYPTHDGTGVRDYIHVMDLSEGHVSALAYIDNDSATGWDKYSVFNLGTGVGCSVLDMVRAMERVSGKTLPYTISPRRKGDVAACYTDPTFAKKELGWVVKRGLNEMCQDSWNWQSNNINGYDSK